MDNLLIGLTVLMTILMWVDRRTQSAGKDPGLLFSALLLASIVVAVSLHAISIGGFWWAFKFAAILAFVPFLSEAVGVKTGIPFGKYDYDSSIGPRLPFGVPVAVAGTWLIVLYSATIFAFTVVAAVFGETADSFVARAMVVLLASILTVIFDLIAEPISVTHGYWHWRRELDNPSALSRRLGNRWHGIPTVNFLGWWLTAVGTLTVALLVVGEPAAPSDVGWWLFALPIFWGWSTQLYAAGAASKFHLPQIAKWSRRLAWFDLYAYLLLGSAISRWFFFDFLAAILNALLFEK